MKFVPLAPIPNEEHGFTNHLHRMDDARFPDEVAPYGDKAWANRIVVVTERIEAAKAVQRNLPREFRTLEPITLQEAIERNTRTPAEQIIYASETDLRKDKRLFTLVYALIGPTTDSAGWCDWRDQTDCKWGRQGKTREETIRSTPVLNGLVDIYQFRD